MYLVNGKIDHLTPIGNLYLRWNPARPTGRVARVYPDDGHIAAKNEREWGPAAWTLAARRADAGHEAESGREAGGGESKTEEEGCGEKESASQEKSREEKSSQESGEEEVTQPLGRPPRSARRTLLFFSAARANGCSSRAVSHGAHGEKQKRRHKGHEGHEGKTTNN